MELHPELSGPEFLDAVADIEQSNGSYINASEYRRRAHQWKRDQEALQQERAANQALKDRLTEIRLQTIVVTNR